MTAFGSVDPLQFYVTPPELAARVWAKFKDRHFSRMLDAFSGTGALADAADGQHDRYRSHHREVRIDCIEIDASKHPTLREKGFTVVGLDFFEFEGGEIYSHVIMNPPFAQGAQAVLKAWDMLWEGEIAAILNAETVRNLCNRDREQLGRLIATHGSVEFVADAFKGTHVEREAEVEVAIVHLVKPPECARDWIGPIIDSMAVDPHQESDFTLPGELALPRTFIENQCAAFRAAVKAMRESTRMEAVASHYEARIGATMADAAQGRTSDGEKLMDIRAAREERYGKLKDRAWTSVLRSTETLSRLSQKVQRQAEAQFESIKKLDFTEPNVYGFLLGVVQSQPDMQMDMACDVFDQITQYHTDNAVYYRGWKSNDKHRTCGIRIKTTRFIIPGHADGYSWSTSPGWGTQQMLADFDKVFAMMDGKREPELSLNRVFNTRFQDLRNGARVSSSYFDVRYYPGSGTIHFFARDKSVIDRLNRFVGQHRRWLPPAGTPVHESFRLQYDQAEKFDREVRAEVKKAHGSRWDDPFWASRRGGDEGLAAADKIAAAVEQVLVARGITLVLDAPAQAPDPMLLLPGVQQSLMDPESDDDDLLAA